NKNELVTLSLICTAWQSLEEAVAFSDHERYEKAAQIFGQAAESAISERTALVVRGHAEYCWALKSGTQILPKIHDPSIYRQTKEHLEVAVDCYTRAGVSRRAQWARGTER